MTQPISYKYTCPIAFSKAKKNKNNCNYFGGKAAERVNSDLDFQRKVVEQNERMIVIGGVLGTALLLSTFLWNLKYGIEIFAKKDLLKSKIKTNFKSLKDNDNIPKLNDCKSINKDLKDLLQRQVNLVNANKTILDETDNPQVVNRLLLSGPPGVGKSFFAKIFAKTLDAKYMEVLFSDLDSRWVGVTDEKMKKLFKSILKEAKKNPECKYVVTFNEADAFLVPIEKLSGSSEGGTHWISKREERSTFLNYLETLQEEAQNVIVIATTNMSPQKNNLDGAAMSRFQRIIEVPYPDKDCLFEALKMNIKNNDKFIAENETILRKMAKKMEDRGFSFRNLEFVINEAKSQHLQDKLKDNNAKFKVDYLKKAEESLKKSDAELECK